MSKTTDARAELDAMRKIFEVLEPMERAERARVMLMVVLATAPLELTYEQQLHLLRIANGQ